MVSPGLSSVPAKRPPIMTVCAPAASALVTSPENLMPPSAMTGTPARSAGPMASPMAVSWHAHAGDDARGADRGGTHADLDRVDTRLDQRGAGFGRPDVAGDEIDPREGALHGAHGLDDRLRVPVRRVHHQHVRPGAHQRLGARLAVGAGADRGPDAQPPPLVLGRVREADGRLDVLDGDRAE